MSNKVNGNEQNQQPNQEEQSVLLFKFVAPGSCRFEMQMQHVDATQLLAVAAWLDWKGRQLLDEQVAREREVALVRARGSLPPDSRLFKGH